MPTLHSTHDTPRTLTDDFFAGVLKPDRFDELFGHLRWCESCRGHFEQVRRSFRATGPVGPGLRRHEADLLKRQLLAEAAAPQRRPGFLQGLRARWRALLGAAGMLAAATLAVVLVVRAPDELAARGERQGRLQEWAQVLCLRRLGEEVATSSRRDDTGRYLCEAGGFLMLAATPHATHPHLTAVLIGPASRAEWTTRLSRDTGQALFEGYFALPSAGEYRLAIVGTAQPLGEPEVAALVRGEQLGGATRQDLALKVGP